jgi:hypothetical protein
MIDNMTHDPFEVERLRLAWAEHEEAIAEAQKTQQRQFLVALRIRQEMMPPVNFLRRLIQGALESLGLNVVVVEVLPPVTATESSPPAEDLATGSRRWSA